MWGGSPSRNNVGQGKIAAIWDPGHFDRKTQKWQGGRNIKWVARLGSYTYGTPVVADGKIFIGTNNSSGYLKRYPFNLDLGVLLCFRESDGKFLWQHSSEKLSTERVHDWELQGVCSTPLVEGNRLWFVTNRGEVVCLDTEGFLDGQDDGPVKGEWARLFNVSRPNDPDKQDDLAPALASLRQLRLTDYMRDSFARTGMPLPDGAMIAPGQAPKTWRLTAQVNGEMRSFHLKMEGLKLAVYARITPDDKQEADVIWRLDMMKQLGVSQHNMANCSPVAWGDVLFICTSNGVDNSHVNIPAPAAPSFIAIDKQTGEVLWTDRSPGQNILHGQWSVPAVAKLGGVPQVIFGGGDGWVYSFRADTWDKKRRQPIPLWRFDANPKESKWISAGRGTRNNVVSFPVIEDGLVYIAVGQDPEHGEGEGHLWCIDPTKRGDVSPQLAMKIVNDRRVPIPHRRLQAVIKEQGEVAVDNPNSAVVWHYDKFDQNGDGKIEFAETFHRCVGTVAVKGDLLFISDFSGLVHCLGAKTGNVHWTSDLYAQVWGSPLIVDGRVFICDEDGDVAIFTLSSDPKLSLKRPVKKDSYARLEPIQQINMGNSVNTTPIFANDVLYIASRSFLFAIRGEAKQPIDK